MTERTKLALCVAGRLNAGKKPTEALEACDVDPETVYTENDEVFTLDDPDNDIIDFGWRDGELILIRCVARDRATGSGTCWEVHRTEIVRQQTEPEIITIPGVVGRETMWAIRKDDQILSQWSTPESAKAELRRLNG